MTAILRLLRRQLWFWLLSGGVGFGVFYACICYAADRAPGWIVAASWQLTILATPIIMSAFGTRVPLRGSGQNPAAAPGPSRTYEAVVPSVERLKLRAEFVKSNLL